MNYLSDDEDNINVPTEPTFYELYPQFEEEIDEEMMEIIRKHAIKEDNFSYQIIEKEKTILQKDNLKKDKLKKNKKLTEFIKEEVSYIP